MLIKKKNNKAEDNSSQGVNETAIDLFASLTAVMMIVTASFFTTMTDQLGSKIDDKKNITDQYYLIYFGINDEEKRLKTIKDFEKRVGSSLKNIGNHSPSLWHVKKNNKTNRNIVIKSEEDTGKFNTDILMKKRLEWTFNEMENMLDTNFPRVHRRTKSQQFEAQTYLLDDLDFKKNLTTTKSNFQLTFIVRDKVNNPKKDIRYQWLCFKKTFECFLTTKTFPFDPITYKERFKNIEDFNKYFCKNDYTHNTLNVWNNSKWNDQTYKIQLNELLSYILKLIDSKHIEYACSGNNSKVISSAKDIIVLKNKYLITLPSSLQQNIFRFNNITNPNSVWQKPKKYDCLDIVNGKLSFSECPTPIHNGINHAR